MVICTVFLVRLWLYLLANRLQIVRTYNRPPTKVKSKYSRSK